MNFNLFLQEASKPDFLAQSPNICFRSDDFSPLFFNHLLTNLEKNGYFPYPKLRLDLTAYDQKALLAALNQSILGSNSVFWLSNIAAEGIVKGKQNIITYLFSYQGPHHIMYFLPKDVKLTPGEKVVIIDVPYQVDFATAETILSFFYQKNQRKKCDALKRIFKQTKTLPLDTLCMLVHYTELMNSKNGNELDSYLANITQTQPSLSLLSESFFSNNAADFFAVWSEVERTYPDMFWLAFWSEQFWKAYHVVSFLKKQDFINAKRMSFRLPYSFINIHWKKFSQQELSNFYQDMYLIDAKIKRGCSSNAAMSFFFCSYFFKKSQRNSQTNVI